jgi:hypothetical protein
MDDLGYGSFGWTNNLSSLMAAVLTVTVEHSNYHGVRGSHIKMMADITTSPITDTDI